MLYYYRLSDEYYVISSFYYSFEDKKDGLYHLFVFTNNFLLN